MNKNAQIFLYYVVRSELKAPSHPSVCVLTGSLRLKNRVFFRCNVRSPYVILRLQPRCNSRGRKMHMPIFVHVFSTSDRTCRACAWHACHVHKTCKSEALKVCVRLSSFHPTSVLKHTYVPPISSRVFR